MSFPSTTAAAGGGYSLTVLGLLNPERIARIWASDIDPEMLKVAGKNLSLLTPAGMAARLDQLKGCLLYTSYINSHHAIDVSVIGILSTVLLKGPYAGVTVYLVSSLFTVDHDKETGQYHHIYNTPPTKTLFNLGNLVVSILLPGLLIQWTVSYTHLDVYKRQPLDLSGN